MIVPMLLQQIGTTAMIQTKYRPCRRGVVYPQSRHVVVFMNHRTPHLRPSNIPPQPNKSQAACGGSIPPSPILHPFSICTQYDAQSKYCTPHYPLNGWKTTPTWPASLHPWPIIQALQLPLAREVCSQMYHARGKAHVDRSDRRVR
ncbi:hypothetical protein BP00DRAFT_13934 [Aspergillus indologenus CBS 114.80]|uniref:Uncharacterized protein n=1 Tax=Aspergillus indologenus CBS 114.80 TaxID=1450541 RepID=A0A2V5J2M1_9EURO|nr:hypothetical protein BP00DRAFT_13934 [Aspergillus indologenus CBS 114.80]